MPTMKNRTYGAPLGDEESVAASDRNTVREGSDADRKAAIAAARAPTPSAPPSSSTPADEDSPTKDLSAAGAAQKVSGRQRQIDKAVEDAGG